MGQKVNPIGLRLGINRTWDSRWFARHDYATLLHQDLAIRKFIQDRLSQAGVSKVVIERPAKKARVTIHTARPGIVIGKKGADIDKLKGELSKIAGTEVSLNILEKVIRINVSGRLGGSEIARMEWYREGQVPLQSLRADIDYGEATAMTTYGTIGVKVWIYKGDIMEHDPMAYDKRSALHMVNRTAS